MPWAGALGGHHAAQLTSAADAHLAFPKINTLSLPRPAGAPADSRDGAVVTAERAAVTFSGEREPGRPPPQAAPPQRRQGFRTYGRSEVLFG